MRDWTKAMAALLAAVSSVGFVQAISAQETGKATAPAVTADEADPFAQATVAPAPQVPTDLSKDQLNVTDLGMVDLQVKDVPIQDILRMLSLQTKKNIVASKSVQGPVTANLYNVTVREALDAILHANGYAYREKGNFIYVYTVKELQEIEKSERKLVTKVFRLNYIPGATAVDMIKPVLSGDAPAPAVYKEKDFQISAEAETVEFTGYTAQDVIVVTDYADVVEQVGNILKDLDKRPQQILVEATILQVTLSDDNALGVDFTLLGSVDFETLTGAGLDTSDALGTGLVDAATGGPIADDGYNATGTRLIEGANGQAKPGLNVGLAYNNVSVFVNALESVTDTVVLANPKVLTLNRQPGVVIVGSKDGYLTTTVTQTSTVQTVEYLETGTRLIFKPTIGDDGYVQMMIHPEDSTGSVRAVGTAALPTKQTAEVTTNVLVKDGHTIVIGGLFRESSSITKSQVPVLGDIPFAGALFRSQADASTRQEIVILITPHIIKDDVAYAGLSEEMEEHAEAMRVGVRRGMMPWSRDRLAEMCYSKARDAVAKGEYNRDRVLWHLDCATNLRPLFSEAIELKQEISGEQLTVSDDSSFRGFLRAAILNDVAPAKVEPEVAPVAPDAATTEEKSEAPAQQDATPAVAAPEEAQPSVATPPAAEPSLPLTPADQPKVTEPTLVPPPAEVPATTPPAEQAAPAAESPAAEDTAAPAVRELPAEGAVDDTNK